MFGTETIKHTVEIDLRSSIITFLTGVRVIQNDRDIQEMKFTITNKSLVFSSKTIVFDIEFRRRKMEITIEIASDIFSTSPHRDAVTNFTIDQLVEIDTTFFERSMGKVLLRAETQTQLSSQ